MNCRLLYELPSALADGKKCNYRQALAKYKIRNSLSALAEAIRMIDNLDKFGSSRRF
jgi:hypothetical protein